MQVTTGDRLATRSVTATARRAQIVAATIDVIVESGYSQTSFARIAERAGLSSTRLISYHFAGKAELVAAVVTEITTAIGRHMAQRMAGQPDAKHELDAYIRGLVEFIKDHPVQMQALTGIFLDFRTDDGGRSYDASNENDTLGVVQDMLRAGQDAGLFRDFDTFVMASAIQRCLDGLPFLLQTRPELDLDAYGEELVTLFDLATRSER